MFCAAAGDNPANRRIIIAIPIFVIEWQTRE
jgi:hypothetical protein